MEENTQNKIGTFVSSAVSRIINIVMILVIIALVSLVAYFWHNNELLKQSNTDLQDKIEKFEEMNNQAGSRDVIFKNGNKERELSVEMDFEEYEKIKKEDELIFKNGSEERIESLLPPEKIAYEYYEGHLKDLNNGERFDIFSLDYITQDYKERMKNYNKNKPGGGNRILCAQDFPDNVSELRVKLISQDDNLAKVDVNILDDWKNNFNHGTVLDLVKINNDWRINNIICKNK